MKTNLEKMDGLFRRIHVELPEEQVAQSYKKAIKGVQQKATLKGFRKGKAPLAQIKLVYGDQVREDVLNQLVSDSYSQALDEHNLDPVGYPNVKIMQFDPEKKLAYSAELEVRPEVKVEKFSGLQIKSPKVEVKEAEITDVLENIRQSNTQTIPIFESRPAQAGDVATLDFEGFLGGLTPLEGGSATDYSLELGSKQFIEGFEDQMIGMKPGEKKEIHCKFPDEYHSKDLSGRDVMFKVLLKDLKKKVLPDLDDDLAKKAGPFESLTDLTNKIREDLTERKKTEVKDFQKNAILKELARLNPVDAPKTMVAEQTKAIREDIDKKLSQQGMQGEQLSQYHEKWAKDYEESAVFMVQSSFLISKIADDHDLRPKKEAVETKLQDYANRMGVSIETVRDFYKDGDLQARLMFQLTEEAVVDFLLQKASIEEVDSIDSGAS